MRVVQPCEGALRKAVTITLCNYIPLCKFLLRKFHEQYVEAIAILLRTLLQAMALKQFILTATEPTENYLSSERTYNSDQYRINSSSCQCLGCSQLICSIYSLTDNACAIHTMDHIPAALLTGAAQQSTIGINVPETC